MYTAKHRWGERKLMVGLALLFGAAVPGGPGRLAVSYASGAQPSRAAVVSQWSPRGVLFSSPGGHVGCRIRMGAYLSTSIYLSRTIRAGKLELAIGDGFAGGIVSVTGGAVRLTYGETAERDVALSTVAAHTTLRVVYYLVVPERTAVGGYSGTLTISAAGATGRRLIGGSYAISMQVFPYMSGRQSSITAVR